MIPTISKSKTTRCKEKLKNKADKTHLICEEMVQIRTPADTNSNCPGFSCLTGVSATQVNLKHYYETRLIIWKLFQLISDTWFRLMRPGGKSRQ